MQKRDRADIIRGRGEGGGGVKHMEAMWSKQTLNVEFNGKRRTAGQLRTESKLTVKL